MSILSREQVENLNKAADVAEAKCIDVQLTPQAARNIADTDAALREELATMTACYEASKGTQTAEYVAGLLQHRTQVVSENAALRQPVAELEETLRIWQNSDLALSVVFYQNALRDEKDKLAAVTQELENEKRSYAECFEERRRLIAQRDALQARFQAMEGALQAIAEPDSRPLLQAYEDSPMSNVDAIIEVLNNCRATAKAALRGQETSL